MKVYMGYTLLFITICFAYFRIYYGIDFTDESYTIAMPYLFSKGQVPFVDEILAHQGSAFLLQPFLTLYVKTVGSTDGIVLFSRHVFFIFSIAFSSALFFIIKKYYSFASAVFATMINIIYVPFSLYCLHYNYLGSSFFLLFLLLIVLSSYTAPMSILIACLAGFSCLTYPTFVLPIFLAYIYALIRKDRSSHSKVILFISTLIAAIFFSVFMLSYGYENILHILQITRSADIWGGDSKKVILFTAQFYQYLSPFDKFIKYFFAPITLFIFGFWIQKRISSRDLLTAVLMTAPLVYFYFYNSFHSEFFYIFLVLPLLFIILILYLMAYFNSTRTEKNRAQQNFIMILVSIFAGLVTAYTSANGLPNFGVGGYAALLVTATSLFFYLVDIKKKWISGAIFFICMFIPLVQTGMLIAYRDVAPLNMNTTLEKSGPFYGLKTSAEKAQLLDIIQSILNPFKGETNPVLFYDFPAGYLMLSNPPRTNSTWLLDKNTFPIDQSIYSNYLKQKGLPQTVFMFKWDIASSGNQALMNSYEQNSLYLFFKNSYSQKKSPTPWLDIFHF